MIGERNAGRDYFRGGEQGVKNFGSTANFLVMETEEH
jgi:hypothetical protein